MLLEISQNLQENTCARVSFLIKAQVFSYEFCEISKKTFLHRISLVAASGLLSGQWETQLRHSGHTQGKQ